MPKNITGTNQWTDPIVTPVDGDPVVQAGPGGIGMERVVQGLVNRDTFLRTRIDDALAGFDLSNYYTRPEIDAKLLGHLTPSSMTATNDIVAANGSIYAQSNVVVRHGVLHIGNSGTLFIGPYWEGGITLPPHITSWGGVFTTSTFRAWSEIGSWETWHQFSLGANGQNQYLFHTTGHGGGLSVDWHVAGVNWSGVLEIINGIVRSNFGISASMINGITAEAYTALFQKAGIDPARDYPPSAEYRKREAEMKACVARAFAAQPQVPKEMLDPTYVAPEHAPFEGPDKPPAR